MTQPKNKNTIWTLEHTQFIKYLNTFLILDLLFELQSNKYHRIYNGKT
jgi:hypothetical protein